MAAGSKVLFCNFSNDKYYDMPDGKSHGPWALSNPDVTYSEFSKRLDLLYSMTDSQWLDLTRCIGQEFVQIADDSMPQDILANEIKSGLEDYRSNAKYD